METSDKDLTLIQYKQIIKKSTWLTIGEVAENQYTPTFDLKKKQNNNIVRNRLCFFLCQLKK